MTTDLVLKALKQAIFHRNPNSGLVHHSDKGSQYTSKDFQTLLSMNEIVASMSGTGNCYDNAAMESFFHTLKTEHVYFEYYLTRKQQCKVFLNMWKFFIIENAVIQHWDIYHQLFLKSNGNKKMASLFLLSIKVLQDHIHTASY